MAPRIMVLLQYAGVSGVAAKELWFTTCYSYFGLLIVIILAAV